MVAQRNKLSTRFDGSVFYHILENENAMSASEEVHERNFRDLCYVDVRANEYVHELIGIKMNNVIHPHRFLIFWTILYMPLVDDLHEETMLGVFSPYYYIQPDLRYYSFNDVMNGNHIHLNYDLINNEYNSMMSSVSWNDEIYYRSYFTSQ